MWTHITTFSSKKPKTFDNIQYVVNNMLLIISIFNWSVKIPQMIIYVKKMKTIFGLKMDRGSFHPIVRKIAARRTNMIKMCEEKCKFHHSVCFTPGFASHVDRHCTSVNVKYSRNTKCLPSILYSVVWPFSIWHEFYFYSELLIFLSCNSLMTWRKLSIADSLW